MPTITISNKKIVIFTYCVLTLPCIDTIKIRYILQTSVLFICLLALGVTVNSIKYIYVTTYVTRGRGLAVVFIIYLIFMLNKNIWKCNV